jgi:hypothetical protein
MLQTTMFQCALVAAISFMFAFPQLTFAQPARRAVKPQHGVNTFGGDWNSRDAQDDDNRLELSGKFIVEFDYDFKNPENNTPMEVEVFLQNDDEVAVGVALAAEGRGDVGQLVIWGRELDAETGKLVGREEMRADNGNVTQLIIEPRGGSQGDQAVMIGWGARANKGDLTHIAIAYRQIKEDGTLGRLDWHERHLDGHRYIAPEDMERKIYFEKPYVMQKIGARMKTGGGNDDDRIRNLAARYGRIAPENR